MKSNWKLFSLKFSGLISQTLNAVTIFQTLNKRILYKQLVDVRCLSNAFIDAINRSGNNLETLQLENIHFTSIDIKSRKPLLNLKQLTLKDCYMYNEQFDNIMLSAPNLTYFGATYSSRLGHVYLHISYEITENYLKN